MSDYISRDSIRQKLWNKSYTDPIDATEVCGIINIEPSVDVRENIHGEWISAKVGKLFPSNDYKCSICGNILDFDGVNCGRGDANFCPNCGADMRGVENVD